MQGYGPFLCTWHGKPLFKRVSVHSVIISTKTPVFDMVQEIMTKKGSKTEGFRSVFIHNYQRKHFFCTSLDRWGRPGIRYRL